MTAIPLLLATLEAAPTGSPSPGPPRPDLRSIIGAMIDRFAGIQRQLAPPPARRLTPPAERPAGAGPHRHTPHTQEVAGGGRR